MRSPAFAFPGALTRGLMAAVLAAVLTGPASAAAGDVFDRNGLLDDALVREAINVLVDYPSLAQPTQETFDAACWKAAAEQKTPETQRTACLYAAAQLLGSESRFLVAKGSRPLNAGPIGFAGIGVTIKKSDDGIEVTDLLPQGPAHRAGARVGDRLTHANGTPLPGLSIEAVTALLRGDPGSRLRLEAASKAGDRRTLEVERAQVSWPGEAARRIPGGWYLQIRSVDSGAGDRVRALIQQAHAQGDLSGTLVLDLRGNTGGLTHDIVDLAIALLHTDDIVMTMLSITNINRNAISRNDGVHSQAESHAKTDYQQAQKVLQTLPLVVLTDDKVSSGSTWLLATLRARRNTYTMGQTTSTSAVVLQQVDAYGNGAGLFRLPLSYLYAEGAGALHGTGIVPDFARPAEPVITAEPPTWLQAALVAHAKQLRQPRLTPALAPGGATTGQAATRQCVGPVSLDAGSAPRWVQSSQANQGIRLGNTTLNLFIDQSEADHRALVKKRSEGIQAALAAMTRHEVELIAMLSRKGPSTANNKARLQNAKKELQQLTIRIEEQVTGHPGAALLTRRNSDGSAWSELWWWHDGVGYALEGHQEADDLRGLATWLDRFVPGAPSLPDNTLSLCLPNARLTLPADVGPVEGQIGFKLAATGDSIWTIGFSNQPVDLHDNSVHDAWLLLGDYKGHSPLVENRRCSARDRTRQQPPVPQVIAGRPGTLVQLDGPACGLTRAAMLPVLRETDPWNLGFGLFHAESKEAARNDLGAWRQTLGSVRWGPMPPVGGESDR